MFANVFSKTSKVLVKYPRLTLARGSNTNLFIKDSSLCIRSFSAFQSGNEPQRNRKTSWIRKALSLNRDTSSNDSESPWFRRAIGAGGALAFLAAKSKWVFAILKMTKLSSLLSMLAYTATYALFFGWPYAVGAVAQIFIHESGHAVALKYLNIPYGPAVFIPFMGAVIPMLGRAKNVKEEAMVAIAGPVFGGAAALGLSLGGILTDNQLLISLADFGYMINLFNMLPLWTLDGARVSGAISKHMLLAGLGGGVYLAYAGIIHNPLFYLILLGGGYTCFQRYFLDSGEDPSYFFISTGERLVWSAAYFGLVLALFVGMQLNKQYLKSTRRLRVESGRSDISENEASVERFAKEYAMDDPYLKQTTGSDTWGRF